MYSTRQYKTNPENNKKNRYIKNSLGNIPAILKIMYDFCTSLDNKIYENKYRKVVIKEKQMVFIIKYNTKICLITIAKPLASGGSLWKRGEMD